LEIVKDMQTYTDDFAKSRTFWVLVFGLALSLMPAMAAEVPPPPSEVSPAQIWIDEVAAPLRAVKDLELKFSASVQMPESESPERYLGTLWVGDSTRFRLEIPIGTYVSDGKTFWEYHPRTHQVLIRDGGDKAGRALPGRILVDLLASPPLSCDTLKEKGKSQVRIRLSPTAKTGQLDSLEVRIDLKRRKLEWVETLDANGGRTRYQVRGLKQGNPIPDSRFQFEKPKSAEIVDMRP
jgi:outer membrane lipoprotein-sorting protein